MESYVKSHGEARHGGARQGKAGLGKARQGGDYDIEILIKERQRVKAGVTKLVRLKN